MEIKISKDRTWLMNWMDERGYLKPTPRKPTAEEILARIRGLQKGRDDD